MSPGEWGPGSEVRCARCGTHPLFSCVMVDDGYVCEDCARCSRCAVMFETFVLPGGGVRVCRSCLTVPEQAALGHTGTPVPEIRVVEG